MRRRRFVAARNGVGAPVRKPRRIQGDPKAIASSIGTGAGGTGSAPVAPLEAKRPDMNELATTSHGRLLSIAITLALAGGGISATIHDPMGIALMCVSLLGAVVLTLMALAMSISKRPAFAVVATVVLPLVFFLYAVGLTVSIHHKAGWAAYGFIAIGALFGLNALRGGKPSEAAHETPSAAH